MAARRVLVTGANRGIGLAIAKAVLRHSPENVVLVGSRLLANGEAAVAALVSEDPALAGRVEALEIDVTSIESIRAAAALVAQKGGLFGLVNNAGVLAKPSQDVLATNLIGVKSVCDVFLPLVSDRVVMISSGAASSFCSKCSPERVSQMVDDSITWTQIEALTGDFLGAGSETEAAGFGPWDADWTPYGFSKALLNSLTIQLSRDFPRLKINACSPGMIATDLFADFAKNKGVSVEESIAGWGAKPPSESTIAPLFLLFGCEQTGFYYGSDGKRSPFAKYRSPGSEEYDGSDGR